LTIQGKSLTVLFVILFLVMMGFGIIIPILPFYVLQKQGNATTLGFLMASYSLMQFFFAPFWGKMSDNIGRKPVLMIGLGGYALTFILFALATRLWMLFLIRLLSGFISSAALPTAMAYVADITEDKDRAKGMGLMGAALGSGMIFGPALGGWLGHFSLSMPFFTAGAIALLTLPFAFFLLPESKKTPKEEKTKAQFSWKIYNHPQFNLFLFSFLVSFSMALFEGTFALFAAEKAHFGPRQLGTVFALLGFLGVIIQGGLLGKLVNKYGDVKIIKYGMIISIIGFLLLLFVANGSQLLLFTAIFSIGNSLLRSSLPSLLTKVAKDGQGTIIGIMQSFDSLGRIIGPIAGGFFFSLSSSLPYAVSALILFLILLGSKKKLQEYNLLLTNRE